MVNIPGFEGYLSTRYSTDLGVWRDRIVFDLQPQQIEQVSIRYEQEPLNSFTLTQKDGKVSVTLDTALHYDKPLNERRARGYLTFFSRLYSEGYANGMIDLDTTVRQMPGKQLSTYAVPEDIISRSGFIYYPLTSRSKNAGCNAHIFRRQGIIPTATMRS